MLETFIQHWVHVKICLLGSTVLIGLLCVRQIAVTAHTRRVSRYRRLPPFIWQLTTAEACVFAGRCGFRSSSSSPESLWSPRPAPGRASRCPLPLLLPMPIFLGSHPALPARYCLHNRAMCRSYCQYPGQPRSRQISIRFWPRRMASR